MLTTATLPLLSFSVLLFLSTTFSSTHANTLKLKSNPENLRSSSILIAISPPTSSPVSNTRHQAESELTSRAVSSFHTLQKIYYNSTSGLYDTTGWWNSANCITTIGILGALSASKADDDVNLHRDWRPAKSKRLVEEVEWVLENTFEKAPVVSELGVRTRKNIITLGNEDERRGFGIENGGERNVQMGDDGSWGMIQNNRQKKLQVEERGGRWLNDYYDDEGWWALAWIQAYDLTGKKKYLQTAVDIFNNMEKNATTPCGGIWWDKRNTYINAISNSLFLSVSAHLSNRAPEPHQRRRYLQIALQQWKWFSSTGMLNPSHLVNDGLTTSTCKNNHGTIWSYNQGVLISALVELSQAIITTTHSRDSSQPQHESGRPTPRELIDLCLKVARAAIQHLSTPHGILTDPCEPHSCGADGKQFKGVFMRGLMRLSEIRGDKEVEGFVLRNAESIWVNDRNERGLLGLVWSGPVMEVDASSMCSGLDGLVVAAAAAARLARGG